MEAGGVRPPDSRQSLCGQGTREETGPESGTARLSTPSDARGPRLRLRAVRR